MAITSDDSQLQADGTTQEPRARQPAQLEGQDRIGSLRHLFGPAYVVGAVSLLVISTLLVFKGSPPPFPQFDMTVDRSGLKDLFDHTLSDYKAGLAKLDTNLAAQALVVATAVLVIIRRSDSLNFFGNSIPLSWLHAFIPLLLIFLFMAYGYISHRLIASRMLGVELSCELSQPSMGNGKVKLGEAKCGANNNPHQELFRDASWIDGWFISFIDTDGANVSGIDRKYASFIKVLLIVVLGTQTAAAHASTLAIISIGVRRYFATRYQRRLVWYYLLPLAPLTFLGISHFLMAYAGPHRNSYQLYVAAASVAIMAFLLWLSARIDDVSYPETLQCLQRRRQVTVWPNRIERSPLQSSLGLRGDPERTIALIGDSLSTAFYVSSRSRMLVRTRLGWKTNWFLTLPIGNESVVMRLSAFGAITGIQHASVAAMVDVDKRRSVLNFLMSTYHFRHQVDEVLMGPFPDMLLIWIGHNDIDWRWRTSTLTAKSMMDLSDSFIRAYESHLCRLLAGACQSGNCSVIIVFGLVDFDSFFRSRADAEALKNADGSSFPHLETAYKYFASMKPEFRGGMIELAAEFNRQLEKLCNRLSKELSSEKVRLLYSDTMSRTNMEASDLHAIDAWHPSIQGHRKLADSAYPVVLEQAKFLGWKQATSPIHVP